MLRRVRRDDDEPEMVSVTMLSMTMVSRNSGALHGFACPARSAAAFI
jgi:hypothetical protein